MQKRWIFQLVKYLWVSYIKLSEDQMTASCGVAARIPGTIVSEIAGDKVANRIGSEHWSSGRHNNL